MRKKGYFRLGMVGLVVAMLFALIFGEAASPAAQTTIKISVGAGASGYAVEGGVKLFEKRFPEYKVELVRTPWVQLYEKTMAEFLGKTGAYDAVQVLARWYAAVHPYLEDLTPLVQKDGPPLSDFIGDTEFYTVDGKLIGLPFRLFVEYILYGRQDLLEESGLQMPVTWEDYVEAARKLTMDTDGDGEIDIYGTGFEAGGGPESVGLFVANFHTREGRILAADGRDMVPFESRSGKAVVDALRTWQNLVIEGLVPKGVPGWSMYDTLDWFCRGKVALVQMNNARIGVANDPEKSDVAGKVLGGAPPHVISEEWRTPVGFWALTIPNYISEERKKAAWEFTRFLSGYDAQLETALHWANGPVRYDVFDSEEYQRIYPCTQAVVESGPHAVAPPELYIKEARKIEIVIDDALTEVLAGESPEAAGRSMFEGIAEVLGYQYR